MRPLIIITDPSPLGDDVAAITMLIRAQTDVRLIVAVSGNVWANEAACNTRALLQRLRRDDIDICVEMPSPAIKARQRAFAMRTVAPTFPRYIGAFSREPPRTLDGFRVCGDLFPAIAAVGRPDLFVIGPASPIATTIRTHPEIADGVGRVYLMGGALHCEGNATPTAEFNFWFDPNAAETLLASRLAVTLLPLDALRNLCDTAERDAAPDPAKPFSNNVCNSVRNLTSTIVCDEVLAAVALDKRLVLGRRALKLSVETSPGPSYGGVNILDDAAERRPVEVIQEIDKTAFWNLLRCTLALDDMCDQ